jgi:hypothetical protein
MSVLLAAQYLIASNTEKVPQMLLFCHYYRFCLCFLLLPCRYYGKVVGKTRMLSKTRTFTNSRSPRVFGICKITFYFQPKPANRLPLQALINQ